MTRHFQIFLLTAILSSVPVSLYAQNANNNGQNQMGGYNPYGQNYQTGAYPQYIYPGQMGAAGQNNPAVMGQSMPGQPVMIQPVMLQPMIQPQPEIIDINTDTYTLGPSDVLDILVSRHPEVSGNYLVNAEGAIQYEFVGDIVVKGLNKADIKELLVHKLSEYLISPDVTVKISGYNSKVVFIIGEVGSPGKLIMKGDTITVHEALVQAGLLLSSAKATKATIVTPSENGKIVRRPVNLAKLLYKGDMRQNLIMHPGDTLYVPATFLTKTMRVISPVAAPISTAAGTNGNVRGFGTP